MCRLHDKHAETPPDTPQCPFVVRQLNATTFMIRENDAFGEYPQIYVKRITQVTATGQAASVLLINDTGAGTTAPGHGSKQKEWNIRSFIDHHFNADGKMPYLVVLSHCHFDHIMDLKPLLGLSEDATQSSSVNVTIVSSSSAQPFTTPYERLMEHSLCNIFDVAAPSYQPSIWAADNEHITYEHPIGGIMRLPAITIHTPGHTPDSLSWYDAEERVLYVGDTCYEDESDDSRAALWGVERPAPIVFPSEGDLLAWWRSVEKLTAFVEERNKEDGERVTLAAGHVTALVDAQTCLVAVKQFMSKVLRDKTEYKEWFPIRGESFGLWKDSAKRSGDAVGGFRLAAPLRLVSNARQEIPKVEWCADTSSSS